MPPASPKCRAQGYGGSYATTYENGTEVCNKKNQYLGVAACACPSAAYQDWTVARHTLRCNTNGYGVSPPFTSPAALVTQYKDTVKTETCLVMRDVGNQVTAGNFAAAVHKFGAGATVGQIEHYCYLP